VQALYNMMAAPVLPTVYADSLMSGLCRTL
jgi:hypothetical protein